MSRVGIELPELGLGEGRTSFRHDPGFTFVFWVKCRGMSVLVVTLVADCMVTTETVMLRHSPECFKNHVMPCKLRRANMTF